MDKPKVYSFELPEPQMAVVMEVLTKASLPYATSAPVIQSLHNQIQKQQQAAKPEKDPVKK